MKPPTNPEIKMHPIPVSAAKQIAKNYGYDQVVIMARRVGSDPDPRGEHVTTYGVNPENCAVAAIMGDKLKEIAQWPETDATRKYIAELEAKVADLEEQIEDESMEAKARDTYD